MYVVTAREDNIAGTNYFGLISKTLNYEPLS